MKSRAGIWMLIIFAVSMAAALLPAAAQDAPEDSALARGLVLRRTPNIDGFPTADEWTPLYTAADVDVAASWDSRHLYVMLQAPEIPRAVLYLDAQGDGWLNGADNFELTLTPNADGSVEVVPRLYNSFMNSPESALSLTLLPGRAAFRTENGLAALEVAIERNDNAGLELKNGRQMAVAVARASAAGSTEWMPADPRANMQSLTLVNQIQRSPDGLVLDMLMEDREVVAGQTLNVEFFANNHGQEPVEFVNFEIGGEPRIADLVNYMRVRGGSIEPGKRVKQALATELLPGMPVGAFVIVSNMNLPGGEQASVMSSFEVLEPLYTSLDTGSGPLPIGQERRINVIVQNNGPGTISGDVELVVPAELSESLNRTSTRFVARGENSQSKSEFRLRPRDEVPTGEYEILAIVKSQEFERTLKGRVLIGQR